MRNTSASQSLGASSRRRPGPCRQSGVAARLRGVSAVQRRVVWASGSGNTILRSEDGGETWKKLPSPTTDRARLSRHRRRERHTAYVLSIGKGPPSRIYKTTDAGATWMLHFANADPKGFFDAMVFWDDEHGIAMSDTIDGAFVIIRTADGGATWTRVPAEQTAGGAAGRRRVCGERHERRRVRTRTCGSAPVRGRGRACCARPIGARRGRLPKRRWRPGQTSGIFSVAFRDAQHGVIVGGDYSKESEAVDNAAITTDGGQDVDARAKVGAGFRSVVKHVPGSRASSSSRSDRWDPICQPTTARRGRRSRGRVSIRSASRPDEQVGWGAGNRGAIGRLRWFALRHSSKEIIVYGTFEIVAGMALTHARYPSGSPAFSARVADYSEMKRHARDDRVRLEEQRPLDEQRALIVEEVVPRVRRARTPAGRR